MKSQLQDLMKGNDLDAILISGSAQHNPAMAYFTGRYHLTTADLIIPCDGQPLLFHRLMERDEAARTGLPLKCYDHFDLSAIRKQAGGDRILEAMLIYQQMFQTAGIIQGRVAVYGKANLEVLVPALSALEKIMPDLKIVGEPGEPVLLQAMATKSPDEIGRIKRMGEITTSVVAEIADFLTSHRSQRGVLIHSDGLLVRMRDVKRFINRLLIENDAENPEDCIFAIGSDAGVPHSPGNPDDVLHLGKTIVFDIFPCEGGGGYYYDFTRTWCLGYAPDPVISLYEDVLEAYQLVMGSLKANTSTFHYQEQVCDLFASKGHSTLRENPQGTNGYIHGLGHGIGLHIHEAPWFWNKGRALDTDVLYPGSVVTIEPGLYYPEKGMGCRLEDTVSVDFDGNISILATYPLDLVLPVKGD